MGRWDKVDFKDCWGQMPLSWAARGGHEAVIKLLLDSGKADMDLEDKWGWRPRSYAEYYRHEAVIELFDRR